MSAFKFLRVATTPPTRVAVHDEVGDIVGRDRVDAVKVPSGRLAQPFLVIADVVRIYVPGVVAHPAITPLGAARAARTATIKAVLALRILNS